MQSLPRVYFDRQSFLFGENRDFLISGEFHYFRVPSDDWRRRMRIFKETGGNTISTYVPWLLHEPDEGKILFDDCDWRNLSGFLTMAEEEGLYVIIKPGPYVYTEMVNGGIPNWLYEKYPSLKACRRNGEQFNACSYNHPLFLEKVRTWYHAFADIVQPHLITNGGSVIMVQVDNEVTLAHLGNGSIDYNPETMGFGKENGYYSHFLKMRYEGDIAALNAAYGSQYTSFSDVDIRSSGRAGIEAARMERDYNDCYRSSIGAYLEALSDMLRGFGIDVTLIHNGAGAGAVPFLKYAVDKIRKSDFLFGMDSYYNLNYLWGAYNPTVDMFTSILYASDMIRTLGYPFTVLEMQAGNIVEIPPMLKENMYAWYMLHLATGMRGVNYYIFTGGENHAQSGETADIYDYCAPVSADGKARRSLEALKEFHTLLHKHTWLCSAERVSSVQLGVEWQTLCCDSYAGMAGLHRSVGLESRIRNGIMMTLLSSKYSGSYVELTSGIDPNKPLIIESPDTMSCAAQDAVVSYVENGGSLLILSGLPKFDEALNPCTKLAELIGPLSFEPRQKTPSIMIGSHRVYDTDFAEKLTQYPPDAEVAAASVSGDEVLGICVRRGLGKIILLTGRWNISNFGQVEDLEEILDSLGAVPTVECSCRTVYATQFKGYGGRGIFVINLYTGQQETDITIHDGADVIYFNHITLDSMEIRILTY